MFRMMVSRNIFMKRFNCWRTQNSWVISSSFLIECQHWKSETIFFRLTREFASIYAPVFCVSFVYSILNLSALLLVLNFVSSFFWIWELLIANYELSYFTSLFRQSKRAIWLWYCSWCFHLSVLLPGHLHSVLLEMKLVSVLN